MRFPTDISFIFLGLWLILNSCVLHIGHFWQWIGTNDSQNGHLFLPHCPTDAFYSFFNIDFRVEEEFEFFDFLDEDLSFDESDLFTEIFDFLGVFSVVLLINFGAF